MPAHCSQEDRWDHERDLRKHDFPIRLDPKPSTTALEIAVLVKAVDLTMGATLIEQYARTAASEARLDQCNITSDRILSAIEAPLARKEPPYGEWCRKPEACADKGYCPLDPTCGD